MMSISHRTPQTQPLLGRFVTINFLSHTQGLFDPQGVVLNHGRTAPREWFRAMEQRSPGSACKSWKNDPLASGSEPWKTDPPGSGSEPCKNDPQGVLLSHGRLTPREWFRAMQERPPGSACEPWKTDPPGSACESWKNDPLEVVQRHARTTPQGVVLSHGRLTLREWF